MAGKTLGGGSGSWFNSTFRNTPSTANRGTPTTRTNTRRPTHATWAPASDAAGFKAAIGYYPGSPAYNPDAYAGYMAGGIGGLPVPNAPIGPGGPGGGGRGGGGGGGGGGAGGMTQAMFDQMVAALGRQGRPLNLPAFQGQNIAAFNAAPYNQAQQSLNQAVAADRANVNANAQNTTNALNANYRNDYAGTQVTPGAVQQPVGAALQATAGPIAANDPNAQAAASVNGANVDSQAAFGNLLKVLAANANQGQASRLNQVQMDRGTALNSVNAQNLGLGAGINQARAGAQNQWQQQDNERRYQNSLMQQQWQREQGQANWTQNNQQMQQTLQPILDLIASGRGLNTAALTQLLARR